MWLFLCDLSSSLCIHASLQLCITSILHDFTPTFCAGLTAIFYWDHPPEKFWKNHPCSFSTLPVPSSCVNFVWKLLPLYQTWNIERGGDICFISYICSISPQRKQSHQEPLVGPGQTQTPLCWFNAVVPHSSSLFRTNILQQAVKFTTISSEQREIITFTQLK